MPWQPLIENKRLREWVIAGLMLALLAGTLGLAYIAVRKQTKSIAIEGWSTRLQQVGTLEIEIPEEWANRAITTPTTGFESFQIFAPANQSGSHLLIGSLRFAIPRSPDEALALAQSGLRLFGTNFQIVERSGVRAHLMVGRQFTAIERSHSDTIEHFLGVLTEDGRRYWVVYLRMNSPQRNAQAALVNDHAAFQEILLSAIDHEFRDAVSDDFKDAGLPSDDPTLKEIEGLGPRVSISEGFDRPVTLVPVDESPALRLFRVRGSVDPGIDAGSHPLSPDTIFRLEFLKVMNRAASAQEIARTKIGMDDAWRVTFAFNSTAPSELIRELWYTRPKPGYGLLIEIVTEREGLASCRILLPRIIDELKQPAENTDSSEPKSTFEEAAKRGSVLAREISIAARQHHSPGAIYYRIDAKGGGTEDALGYRIDERLPVPDKKTLAGQRLIVIHGERTITARWQMSEDGHQFRWQQQWRTRRPTSKGEELLVQQELDLDNGKLRMLDVGGKKDVWVATLPDSYLGPMLDDIWSQEGTTTRDPALLWVTPEGDPPIACIVQSKAVAAGNNDAAILVSWRPLLRMDADIQVFDSSGHLLQADVNISGSPAGEAVRTLHRVKREELLKTFPQIKVDPPSASSTQPRDR
ncbi:MAG: hypothetical protein IT444_08990 [Phycisphaeraceae bacterium]|nr:hypothetical protein [Phycisphaeraceae bacterium]